MLPRRRTRTKRTNFACAHVQFFFSRGRARRRHRRQCNRAGDEGAVGTPPAHACAACSPRLDMDIFLACALGSFDVAARTASPGCSRPGSCTPLAKGVHSMRARRPLPCAPQLPGVMALVLSISACAYARACAGPRTAFTAQPRESDGRARACRPSPGGSRAEVYQEATCLINMHRSQLPIQPPQPPPVLPRLHHPPKVEGVCPASHSHVIAAPPFEVYTVGTRQCVARAGVDRPRLTKYRNRSPDPTRRSEGLRILNIKRVSIRLGSGLSLARPTSSPARTITTASVPSREEKDHGSAHRTTCAPPSTKKESPAPKGKPCGITVVLEWSPR